MAYVGVRVEPPVRLGSEDKVAKVHLCAQRSSLEPVVLE